MKIEHLSNEIIQMYTEDNLTTVEIAKRIGCSSSAIGRILRRNGIKPFHTPNELRVSTEDQKAICDLYAKGLTTIEIGHKYSLSDNSIAKIIRENGGVIRPAVRRSIVTNHRYFQTIDTPNKAYFLGWMITDGSVIQSKSRSNRTRVISFEIHQRDEYILHEFAKEIGAKDTIVRRNNHRHHCYLHFASKDMAQDLAQYGVVPNKSWITYLPKIRADLMPHLIRGIFDGNGTITIDKKKYPHVAFYGSESLCSQINEYLYQVIGIPLHKVSKSTCYHVWIGGLKQVGLLYHYIYPTSDCLCLTRKRQKFEML